jgi:hypothetical protein
MFDEEYNFWSSHYVIIFILLLLLLLLGQRFVQNPKDKHSDEYPYKGNIEWWGIDTK